MHKEVEVNGRNFKFEGHPDRYLENLSESNEFALAEYAKHHIPKGAKILDIGANIGFISTLFASYNPSSIVYSLEPGAENFNFLKQNIAVNELGNILPHNIALGNSNYFAEFEENSAWGHLGGNKKQSNPTVGLTRVKTVDQFVLDEGIESVDLIKIDVEGFERQVLEGMTFTLNEFNPKVIIEFNTYCLICYGRTDPFSFLELIKEKFEFKYIFSRTRQETNLFSKLENFDFEKKLIHLNIIEHGSVDDLLLFN